MPEYVRWLDSPACEDVPSTGGKGASLARLGAGGFPVPPGFVLTVDAYAEFHEEAGLAPVVEALASLDQRPQMDVVTDAAAPILSRSSRLMQKPPSVTRSKRCVIALGRTQHTRSAQAASARTEPLTASPAYTRRSST